MDGGESEWRGQHTNCLCHPLKCIWELQRPAVVKSTCCSYEGSEFSSQHPCLVTQLPVTPILGHLTPFSVTHRHLHVHALTTHRCTHIHINTCFTKKQHSVSCSLVRFLSLLHFNAAWAAPQTSCCSVSAA